MDTITPDDLQMLRTAQQEAARAQQARQQALKAMRDADALYHQALGAAQFIDRELARRYDIRPSDRTDLDTGQITRAQPAVEASE